MRRTTSTPRPEWERTVRGQGLVYVDTELPDGTLMKYWDETACYVLDMPEVLRLEDVTEELHRMCVAAAHHVVDNDRFADFGIPPYAREAVARSLREDPPSVYGRFDLRYDGVNPPKMLEYNADTPTALVETALVQWSWLEGVHPDRDQWNSLHERLVDQWRAVSPRLPGPTIHFAWSSDDASGEDAMTVGYLAETAYQAGMNVHVMPILDIGHGPDGFVDELDHPITTCFKLYPWEWMLGERFGPYAVAPDASTVWIEPAWKALLSNKALLSVLWELYPGHENLLPAYLDGPRDMAEYVAKPLFGREGASIRIVTRDGERVTDGDYGSEGYCYQRFCPLPEFDGNHVVVGSWVVGGQAAGASFRETKGLITNGYARFLPHYIDAPRGGQPYDEREPA